MSADLEQVCIAPGATIRQAISCIDANRRGIVLVTDQDQRLLGTITDGDVRRAILDGVDLNQTVTTLLERKADTLMPKPVTARVGTDPGQLVALMQKYGVRQIPLLDEKDRVRDLVILSDVVPSQDCGDVQAVIMAGGYGTRLRPITEDLPKPMLPVGDRPLLEHIVNQLREAGIRRLNLTTHYLADKIKDYFGNGEEFGVELNYVTEDSPLGTAGALGLISLPESPLLVINGDILTKVDFKALLAFHREHGAELTIGVRKYDMNVPYGVVECQGPFVQKLVEKPVQRFFVNAGIYLLEPTACAQIKEGEALDMTDLVQRLLAKGRKVASFPIYEYWLDIGQLADYKRAQEDMRNGSFDGAPS